MYYFVEVFSRDGILAGQRTTIGLEAAKALRDHFKASPDFGEVIIYSTDVENGLIDKKERLYV